MSNRKGSRGRTAGTAIIWPGGILDRYGISWTTLWHWEKAGKLPKRDVHVGGRAVGWKPATIERAERGESVTA
jgi:predicted DNA-binding transcriptional regulator AlpA